MGRSWDNKFCHSCGRVRVHFSDKVGKWNCIGKLKDRKSAADCGPRESPSMEAVNAAKVQYDELRSMR